jgi:iron(III) transport system substrate-binding protein
VEAARREGVVSLYGGPSARPAFVEPFEQAFRGIKVDGTFGPGNQLVSRITSERAAGKFIPDVIVGPGTSGLVSLKPAGALASLRPELVLPEVLDTSAWFDNRLWWADVEEPYTTILFQGTVQSPVSYNTRLVDPKEFTSYWDILNPKWKGKIAATDVTSFGAGTLPARFLYRRLGGTFLERLYGEMDVTVSADQRQLTDWLAQGRFPLGLLLGPSQIVPAAEAGLPVAIVPGEQFKEGAPIGPGGGAMSLMDRAPHPHAARVFVNWVLSREGQIAWQKATRENSLRVDVPKDDVRPFSAPRPGVQYEDAGGEEYARISDDEIVDLVKKAMAR